MDAHILDGARGTELLVVDSAATARELGSVLGVWAHPDDEAYLSGALMALASDAGSRVVCVTATRGELGTDDPERWPPHRLARLRERELAASLASLGVIDHRFLDHADGTLATVPLLVGTSVIGDLLDEMRPDTVVTFGPDGMTGHADHRAVGSWVDGAVRDRPASVRLLHATKAKSWLQRHRQLNERIGVFGAAGAPSTRDEEIAVLVTPSDDVLDRKLAALRAQASQTAPLQALIGDATYRDWAANEFFVDASPGSRRRRTT
jgi:LmbE family N-acetylglucosaminyl deacetylase